MPRIPNSSIINYAPKRKRLLHRRGVARAIAGSLVVAILAAGWMWGTPACRKTQLLYWQARCLNYTIASETIVFAPAQRGHIPREWSSYYQALYLHDFNSSGTAFLHERTSPRGNRRLVAIDLHRVPETNLLLANPRTFTPGTLFGRAREMLQVRGRIQIPADARVRAGQPDPDDASHFTIVWELDARQYLIDGWLQDDDLVKLEPRQSQAGVAAVRASPSSVSPHPPGSEATVALRSPDR